MTKEEFINKLSKSNDRLSIIKEIKSIRDIGLNNFVELTDILCEYLSKEEIFEIVIGENSKKDEFKGVDKFKLLVSLNDENILLNEKLQIENRAYYIQLGSYKSDRGEI